MLRKLLKYDLAAMYKFLIIFYSLSLFFGILTRLFFRIENSFIMNVVGQIFSGAAISMMISVLINNLMRLWVLFRKDFYGDKSYLTHTLPVKKRTLYLSKILLTVLTVLSSVAVIGITLFAAYYSKENLQAVKAALLPFANAYESTVVKIIAAFLFVFFLEFVNVIQVGYTGILLGHKMNRSKVVFSVLFGFLTYMALQIVVLGITFISALFNKDLMNLFFTVDLISVDIIKFTVILSIAIYSIMFVVLCFVNIKILNRGVNVD